MFVGVMILRRSAVPDLEKNSIYATKNLRTKLIQQTKPLLALPGTY